MDALRWFLQGVLDLLQSYVQAWASAGAVLGAELGGPGFPPVVGELFGIALGLIVLWAFLNRVFKWAPKANQPQAFPLKTAETPAQVMAKDRENFLGLLLKIFLFFAVLILIISSRQ